MKKLFSHKLILIVVVFLTVGGSFYWYRTSQAQTSSDISYATSTVEQGSLISSVTASGTVAVAQSADVSSEVDGEVSEIRVSEGDVVSAGDVLLVIKNDALNISVTDAYIAYKQAQENVTKKNLDLQEAETHLSDLKTLNKQDDDAVSDFDLDVAKQAIRSAELDVEAADNTVLSRLESYNDAVALAAKREVSAPISGTVTDISVSVGDTVKGSTSGSSSSSTSQATGNGLVSISTLDSLEAEVELNETDIEAVEVGQPVTMVFDAISGFTSTGTVSSVELVGTSNQGVVSYPVTISIDTNNGKIKPGMTVDASIITAKVDNVLYIPNGAINYQNSQAYVQILENGTPVRKDIEIGLANDTDTEVTAGLEVGQEVVTATVDGSDSTSSTDQNRGFELQGIGGGSRPAGSVMRSF